MRIAREEILEWSDIIKKINSFSSVAERDEYLQDTVEDAALFISVLMTVKKDKLKKCGAKNARECKHYVYTRKEIIELFQENDIDTIASTHSKQELIDMYLAFYTSRPLASSDKIKIAQSIYQYIYKMNRTNALLGTRQQ